MASYYFRLYFQYLLSTYFEPDILFYKDKTTEKKNWKKCCLFNELMITISHELPAEDGLKELRWHFSQTIARVIFLVGLPCSKCSLRISCYYLLYVPSVDNFMKFLLFKDDISIIIRCNSYHSCNLAILKSDFIFLPL